MRTALALVSLLVAAPAFASPSQSEREEWGLVRDWQDVTGNRDGIWENEDLAAGDSGWFRGGVERPSKSERDAFNVWKRRELQRMNASRAGSSGNTTAEGLALINMARYGRDVRAFDDRFVTSPAVGAAPEREIYVQRWDAVGPQKVVTVVVPGYTESTQDWMHVANRMNQAGSRVYVFDPPGQGLSSGRKGDVEDSREWLSAYRTVLARARAENPGAKVVVMGHSTGAGAAADDMHDRVLGHVHGQGPDGLVLSAPYLDLKPTILNRVSGVLANIPFVTDVQIPPFLVTLSDDDLGVTRLKQLQKATGTKNTLHFIDEMGKMVKRHEEWLKNATTGITVPLTVVQSKDDPVTNIEASRALVAKTPGAKFVEVAGGAHDLQWGSTAAQDALFQSWLGVVDRSTRGANGRRTDDTRPAGVTGPGTGSTAPGAGAAGINR